MTRGQLLPAWIANVLVTMTFMGFILSYGETISYQFRAQSAADSVAAALVNVQAQQFNEMIETLYAADVEEYRLRHHVESLRILANFSGGCDGGNKRWPEPYVTVHDPAGNGICPGTWATIVDAYHRSLSRYDTDAQILSRITSTMNYENISSDVTQVTNTFNQACAQQATPNMNTTGSWVRSGVDCGKASAPFHYNLIQITQRTNNIQEAYMDAVNNYLPSYHNTGASQANKDMFYPIAVDVSVCAVVPPIFSMTWPLHLQPSVVVARAAATDGIVEEDWLQPGNAINPTSGAKFQPYELYAPIWDTTMNTMMNESASSQSTALAPLTGKGFGWYNVDFAGNPSKTTYEPNPGTGPEYNSSIKATVLNQEFSARASWWGAVSVAPFKVFGSATDAQNAVAAGCST